MDGGFVAGLILGVLLGLVLSPILRSWLLWREIEAARREASLADALLDRLDRPDRMQGNDGLNSWPT